MWERVKNPQISFLLTYKCTMNIFINKERKFIFYLSPDFFILPSLAENVAALKKFGIPLEDYHENGYRLEHSFYSF